MSPAFKNKKVLVADNSPVITRIIKNNLINIGFDGELIITSNDGEHAFMMLEATSFELITTGLHMKNKGGIDLIHEVPPGENNERPRIIVITAERNPTLIEEVKSSGISAYLPKPFTPEQLGNVVNNLFNTGKTIVATATEPSTPVAPMESSQLDIHSGIIQAFVDSTLEAMGQYMVAATAGTPTAHDEFDGYFSSTLDMINKDYGVRLLLALSFPKDVACKIYEGIFGEVDMEQVCGVVQELINIIAGTVKPKIDEFSGDILSLIHPGKDPDNIPDSLNFELGLPKAQMGENHSFDTGEEGDKSFIVPFQVENQKFDLIVVFQKM